MGQVLLHPPDRGGDLATADDHQGPQADRAAPGPTDDGQPGDRGDPLRAARRTRQAQPRLRRSSGQLAVHRRCGSAWPNAVFGTADGQRYAAAVEMVVRGLSGEPEVLLAPLHERMLASPVPRFEEAAGVRDRAQALAGAVRRQRMIEHLRHAGVGQAGDRRRALRTGPRAARPQRTRRRAVPRPAARCPPAAVPVTRSMPREAVDEALCTARLPGLQHGTGHIVALQWRVVGNDEPPASFEPKRQIRERAGRESGRQRGVIAQASIVAPP